MQWRNNGLFMILCQATEINFIKSRISELESLRDREVSFLEKEAFNRIIYSYQVLLNSIIYL